MINNTYKDWFCVDMSVQNDIYRLSGPIVGIWAPQAPVFCPKLFGENLERLDMPSPRKNASKRIHILVMTWRRKKEKYDFLQKWFLHQTVSQCSWVISFRGQKFSFLWPAHFADNCPPRPNGSSDNPRFPLSKNRSFDLVIASTKIGTLSDKRICTEILIMMWNFQSSMSIILKKGVMLQFEAFFVAIKKGRSTK